MSTTTTTQPFGAYTITEAELFEISDVQNSKARRLFLFRFLTVNTRSLFSKINILGTRTISVSSRELNKQESYNGQFSHHLKSITDSGTGKKFGWEVIFQESLFTRFDEEVTQLLKKGSQLDAWTLSYVLVDYLVLALAAVREIFTSECWLYTSRQQTLLTNASIPRLFTGADRQKARQTLEMDMIFLETEFVNLPESKRDAEIFLHYLQSLFGENLDQMHNPDYQLGLVYEVGIVV